MTTYAVEVVYRGIFQKTLSRNICRGIVLAARKEGKIGTAFSRYSDSPERNGIPAKFFAVVADDALELEETLARYQPTEVDVTICLDDSLCKGMESWAWDGLQPVNAVTKETAIYGACVFSGWIFEKTFPEDPSTNAMYSRFRCVYLKV